MQGSCLNPPENAAVICAVEKPDMQALSRKAGFAYGRNWDVLRGIKNTYKRNGTTTLKP